MQTYLLKMARSGEEGEKTFLLLEAGVRLHTTEACLSLQHCPAVLCRLFGRVACVIPPKDTPTAGNGCAPPVQPASSTALKCALLQLACAVLGGGGCLCVATRASSAVFAGLGLVLRSACAQTLVEKSDQPSNFALKLRKHLRSRR